MKFDQTDIQVYCDLEFIIDTIYFNNMSVQTGGGHTFFSENTVLVKSLFNVLSFLAHLSTNCSL